ncbi:SurA N-terminal domain-containing protein [Guptibacillus algicola]|uniref:SurA N-terminal domain-containing protein n=1 Tax=Guptibacillus algicola TaxID=225844 RepID=UPI001CD4115D|nr:SurA N-terminal domain-containing protein [Alkalihalobacillus algicola]MCA0987722.1 SurA N-terminal domain-containing protein [Alkalihalobacillus algicola]
MKKQLSLLVLLAVLLLAACSNNEGEANKEKESTDDTVSMEDTQKELEAMKVDADSVVATVNGEEISGKDYNSMLMQTQLRYTMEGKDPSKTETAETIKKEVMDNLIGQELLLQEAKEQGFEASDKEVETELDQVKSQFESEEQLQEALKAQGITLEQLERQYANIVVVDKYVEENVKTPEVTEEEMKAFYDEQFTKDAENPPSYDEMKDRIKSYLEETKLQKEVQELRNKLKENAEIEEMV